MAESLLVDQEVVGSMVVEARRIASSKRFADALLVS